MRITHTISILLTMFVVLVVSVLPASAEQATTAFTCQGKLTDSSGTPVNGTRSMTFKLYDVPEGGVELAVVSIPAVSVSAGLFTVQLDFGAGVFAGERRWLETTVETEVISPRVEITAAPYALYAQKASWSGLTGTGGTAGGDLSGTYPSPDLASKETSLMKASGGAMTASAGNIGIGTTNPGAKLDVAGQVKITGGNPGSGKVLTSDVSGLASWQAASGAAFPPPDYDSGWVTIPSTEYSLFHLLGGNTDKYVIDLQVKGYAGETTNAGVGSYFGTSGVWWERLNADSVIVHATGGGREVRLRIWVYQ